MASIQQSLNQLLGATAGVATMGSYMYRQSGHYQDMLAEKKAQKLESVADDVGKSQRNLIRDLGKTQAEIEAKGENPDESITFLAQQKAVREVASEKENLLQEAFRTSPSTARLRKYVQANKPGIAMDIFEREKAESNSLSRLQNTIKAQTEQKNGLKDRFDMLREVLSAKERGQLDTMYNRHKNKGELD